MKKQALALKAVVLAIAATGSVAFLPAFGEPDEMTVTSFEPEGLDKEIFNGPGITVTSGKDIYDSICTGCHMPNGEGAVGGGMYPALAGNEKLEYPDYAIFIIVNGYKAMPDFGRILSDEQVASVVNYLQSGLGGNAYEPAATAELVELNRPLPSE